MLIIEDGSGLTTSTSYVTLDQVRFFAAARGKTVPSDDTALEALIIQAHDYIQLRENEYQGWRRFHYQAMTFPRDGMVIYDRPVFVGVMPITLLNAVNQLVLELINQDITPTSDGLLIVNEKIGPISTTYQATGLSVQVPIMPRVEAFIMPLLKGNGALGAVRV